MAATEALVLSWGGLRLDRRAISRIAIELDNGSGAAAHADYAGQRLSYAQTLHALTHAAATVYTCFAGVTTEAAYDALITARAGSPAVVLYMALPDLVNGGTNTYYWSDQVVASVETLWLEPLFTGHIETWSETLNVFALEVTSTDKADEKPLPDKKVGITDWPNSPTGSEGKVYPEVWGTPGSTLDAEKIGAGVGAVPAVLVDRATLQYLVAGHALTSVGGETVEANPVAVWVKIPGYDQGLGYLEGCTFDRTGSADTSGHDIATVTLPATTLARVFLPSVVEGNHFANTATDPQNACGRDSTISATVTAGQILQLAGGDSLEGLGTALLKVWIATSTASANLRLRWTGPQSTTVATGDANGPRVDSVDGWDESGTVEISGTGYTYTSITDITPGSVWRLDVAAYGGPTGAGLAATMVGAWVTDAAQDREVTAQRVWTKGDFLKFELEAESTSGSHSVSYLGWRVQVELTGYPEVLVPCAGANVTFRTVDYGATRNPALIMEDLHTRLLGFAEARIGTTFDAALTTLGSWAFDVPVVDPVQSVELLRELERQARAFTWRDADNVLQIGIYRLGDLSDLTLSSTADIVDPDGDGFKVEQTPIEAISNRVRVRWGWDASRRDFTQEYYITEESSHPQDTVRETAAATSQSTYGVTQETVIDAPHVQDAATALALLQFTFDYQSTRRRRLTFDVPAQVDVRPGVIIIVPHPLLAGNENFLIEGVTRGEHTRTVEAISLSTEGAYEDPVAYDVRLTASVDYLAGSPEWWAAGGANVAVSTQAEVTGRAVDYGLSLFANRHFSDTAEKPAYGGIGSGSAAAAPADVAMGTAVGTRGALINGTADQNVTSGAVRAWSEIGAGTTFGGTGIAALAMLNDTDAAHIGFDGNWLQTIRWNPATLTWSAVGNPIACEGDAITALDSTTVVVSLASGSTVLSVYTWADPDWTLVWSSASLGGSGTDGLAALDSTDFAWINEGVEELRTYRWNGATASQVGNSLSIAGISLIALTALSATDVVLFDSFNEELRRFTWDGTDWLEVGSAYLVSGVAGAGLCAMNNADVAVVDAALEVLQTYRSAGGTFSPIGPGLDVGTITAAVPQIAFMGGADVAVWQPTAAKMRTYRFESTDTTRHRFNVTALGGALTFREGGVMSGASGNNLLLRAVLGADASVPQDATAQVTMTARVRRPSAGSALTDYGCALLANRLFEDTAEKPTHYALGTASTAQAGADVALGAQIGARVAFSTGYPALSALASLYAAAFDATYAPNTVAEVGIFTGATGSNAVLRRVPTVPIVLAAGDTLAVSHGMAATHYI